MLPPDLAFQFLERSARQGSRRLAILSMLLCFETLQSAPPVLTAIFPAGVRAGDQTEASVTGKFGSWPPGIWCSEPGLLVEPLESKGRLRITSTMETPRGTHWIRFHDANGASSLRPFFVGGLREIDEVEPNAALPSAQRLATSRLLINGRLDQKADCDSFSVPLVMGETLVVSLMGNRVLGSPMDAVIQIVDSRGFVLAQNDDGWGLDPFLVFRAPDDAYFVVRVFAFPSAPNSTIRFSSGTNYQYRLTLTTGIYVHHTQPLALQRNGETPKLSLVGWNLPHDSKSWPIPPDLLRQSEPTRSITLGALGWGRAPRLACLDSRIAREQSSANITESDDSLPISISGSISSAKEVDRYRFHAKKGQDLELSVYSRRLGYPLDPVLRLLDGEGKRLGESDDAVGRDAVINYKIPRDGLFVAEVRDRHGHFGVRYAYRLDIGPKIPSLKLHLDSDRFVGERGKTLEIPVKIERLAGFAEDIELRAIGLPASIRILPIPTDANEESGSAKPGKEKPPKVIHLRLLGSEAVSTSFSIVARVSQQAKPPRATAPIAGTGETTTRLWLTIK